MLRTFNCGVGMAVITDIGVLFDVTGSMQSVPRILQKNLPRLVAGVLAALCASAMAASPNRMILPDDVVPDAYRIAVTPHAAEATFDGSVEIDVRVRRRTDRIVLDSAELAIAGATLDAGSDAPRIALDAEDSPVPSAGQPLKVTLTIDEHPERG